MEGTEDNDSDPVARAETELEGVIKKCFCKRSVSEPNNAMMHMGERGYLFQQLKTLGISTTKKISRTCDQGGCNGADRDTGNGSHAQGARASRQVEPLRVHGVCPRVDRGHGSGC